MTDPIAREFDFGKKLFLGVIGLMAIAVSFAFSQQSVVQSIAVSQSGEAATKVPAFAVASIRPSLAGRGMRLAFTSDGFSARGVSVRLLIQEAYGIYEEDRVTQVSNPLNRETYSVEAKVDSADVAAFQNLDLKHRRLILQALLADRFKLAVHRESKDMPIYALVIAKNGPRLVTTKADYIPPTSIKGFGGNVTRSQFGQLSAEWFTMASFSSWLSQQLGRLVVDETGLTDHYDFNLDWEPNDGAAPMLNASNVASTPPPSSGPSLFTALQEQLGLNLKPQKGPVEVLVIDHVEAPSAN